MLTKVYRSGIAQAPDKRRSEAEIFAAADKFRPASRQGRTKAIFASPSLKGVARWVHDNSETNQDPFVREITVESDSVYVYSVNAWEKVCWQNASYKSYWKTGMTLTEYLDLSSVLDYFDPTEWELLLRPSDILSVRDVPDEEFLEACRNSYNHYSEMAKWLQLRRNNLLQYSS